MALCLLRKPLVPSSFISRWYPSITEKCFSVKNGSRHCLPGTGTFAGAHTRSLVLHVGLMTYVQGSASVIASWVPGHWPRAPASDMGLKTAGHAGPRDCSGRAPPPDIVTAPATLFCPPSVQVRDTFCLVYHRRAERTGALNLSTWLSLRTCGPSPRSHLLGSLTRSWCLSLL